jgi:hypothetical protein
MSAPNKADPAIYPKMREHALLKIRLNNLPDDSVHSVLMDWAVANGTATVLAAVDGTASVYLSSGGGYLGGGQKYPAIREAALQAVHLATKLFWEFAPTEKTDLPLGGNVFFYLTTNKDLRIAMANEETLKAGSDPLSALGAAMQQIITEYRLKFPNNQEPNRKTGPLAKLINLFRRR